MKGDQLKTWPMKPIRFKLHFVLELVLGFALGFAAVRGILPLPLSQRIMSMSDAWAIRLPIFIHPVLNAIVLVQFLAVLSEGRSRQEWGGCGVGRWTWLFAGLYFVLHAAITIMGQVLYQDRSPGPMARQGLWELTATELIFGGVGRDFPFALMASWFVLRLGFRPVVPDPDIRELGGVIFGGLLILWGLTLRLCGALF